VSAASWLVADLEAIRQHQFVYPRVVPVAKADPSPGRPVPSEALRRSRVSQRALVEASLLRGRRSMP
jgi:hypothetical protein